MKNGLTKLLRPYGSVSIIGMCKNAGKTTVLNRLIRDAAGAGITLGLTSIGRDGEGKDLVTGTKKPGIYIPEGTLIATASSLVLRDCDVTREILDTTGIPTPMGEVVLVKARSDGSVQLAGPSITSQLAQVRDRLFALGADKVIIDGALSRKSLCSRRVTEATVLCTGASYHQNMATVVADTAYHCQLLTLPETEQALLRPLDQGDDRGIVLVTQEGLQPLPAGVTLEAALRTQPVQAVFFGGALTDHVLAPLIMSPALPAGLELVVRDSTKLLLKQENFEKLLRRGVALRVLSNVHLAAVTVNPFSAYGFHMDAAQLQSQLESRISLPVINVMEEGL